ncbi:MAG: glycosyltransferase family 4 protein [Verrucomicrobiae bacterium]|nr:glycosyltransferase family 4 protein [Verrucomicrobiae bacterium]
MQHRIGFVATRLEGTDGVSLEAEKWAAILEQLGHNCFYFAGASDRPKDRTRVVPEAHFFFPSIREMCAAAFSKRTRPPEITEGIQRTKDLLKEHLRAFVRDFKIDLLISENAITIPLNLPLGMALTEMIAETYIPVIAHHHDFFWERQRFLVNCVSDYLAMAFPPALPSIRHVVINSWAAKMLSQRTGESAMLIPNVMDFERPPAPVDDYARNIRRDLGVEPGEIFFLQPTRVVQRKGIEHAIELIHRMGLKSRLVISNASGDEGDDYEKRVRAYAGLLKVNVNFESDIIRGCRGLTSNGRKIFTLGDVYPQVDMVTYPSTLEGFGNAFLEAVYYRRPLVVNNYSIFDMDIKPKGFHVVGFEGYITDQTVSRTRELLENPSLVDEMTSRNYELALKHYSFAVAKRRLETLVKDCMGE